MSNWNIRGGGSSGQPPVYPTIRQEPEFSEAADALVSENSRYEEALIALEWGVVTNAREYPLAPEFLTGVADMRVAPSDPIGGLDSIRIFFTIDQGDAFTFWLVEKY